jgi:hypothetical protein
MKERGLSFFVYYKMVISLIKFIQSKQSSERIQIEPKLVD